MINISQRAALLVRKFGGEVQDCHREGWFLTRWPSGTNRQGDCFETHGFLLERQKDWQDTGWRDGKEQQKLVIRIEELFSVFDRITETTKDVLSELDIPFAEIGNGIMAIQFPVGTTFGDDDGKGGECEIVLPCGLVLRLIASQTLDLK